MTTSKRLAERKIAKFEKNISKSGSKTSFWKKLTTENIILAVFVFVVVGSFLYQIVRLALMVEEE